ncbi:hypothetical protein BASA61_010424 [Batrachochytrium salamandrivorans]|nr:hypothetical protein BASA60_006531 [Batrachochytrium salamandrivorans]KAH6579226.1 hypothetical protein BASA61_010424 [Batrachochytrium salamandrivorans]
MERISSSAVFSMDPADLGKSSDSWVMHTWLLLSWPYYSFSANPHRSIQNRCILTANSIAASPYAHLSTEQLLNATLSSLDSCQTTYSNTRTIVARAYRAKKAYETLKTSRSLKLGHHQYSALISLLVQSRICKPADIYCIILDMESVHIQPSVRDWEWYLQLLAEHGQLKDVSDTVHQLVEKRIISSEMHVKHLMYDLRRSALADPIRSIILSLLRAEIHISVMSAFSLIHSLGRQSDINNMAYYFKLLSHHRGSDSKMSHDQSSARIVKDDTDKNIIAKAFSSISSDFQIFHSVIRSACAVGNSALALDSYNRMVKSGVKPNLWTFSFLMRMFSKKGDLVGANSVWERLQFMGIKPDIVLCTMLIKLRADKGDIPGMLAIFSESKSLGLTPDCRLYNALLHGYNLINDLESMRLLYINMVVIEKLIPDETTFTIIIHAHIKFGDITGARRWFRTMTGENGSTDAILPPTDHQNTHRELSDMYDIDPTSIPYAGVAISPGVFPYTILMSGLANIGNLDEMGKVFMKMVTSKVAPNLHTYTVIIKGYVAAKNMPAALEVFRQMTTGSSSIKPDIEAYTAIISGYVTAGDFNMAWRWMSEMEEYNLKPTAKIFSIFIDAHIRLSDLHSAYQVYEKMLERNIDPSEHILTALIVHMTRWRNSLKFRKAAHPSPPHHFIEKSDGSLQKMSLNHLTAMEPPVFDPDLSALHNLTLPSKAGEHHGHITRIYSHYRRIIKTTCRPIKIYDAFISHLAYFERVPATRDVFMDMFADQCMPDISIILRMVRIHAVDDDWSNVQKWHRSVTNMVLRIGNEPFGDMGDSSNDSLETIFEKGLLDLPHLNAEPSDPLEANNNLPFMIPSCVPYWQEIHNQERFERNLTAACLSAYGRYAFLSGWAELGKRHGWRRHGLTRSQRTALRLNNGIKDGVEQHDSLDKPTHCSTSTDLAAVPALFPKEGDDSENVRNIISDERLYLGIDIVKYDRKRNCFCILGGLNSPVSLMTYWNTVIAVHERFGVPTYLQPISPNLRQRVSFPELPPRKSTCNAGGGLSSLLSMDSLVDGVSWVDKVLCPDAQFSHFVQLFIRHCELHDAWEARRLALEWLLEHAPH